MSDGGDTGAGDSGGCSNDYSCDYSSNNDHSSSAYTDKHHSSSGHTGNDYAGMGSTVSAFSSAIGVVNSIESANSAFHHRDTSNSINHNPSTRLQTNDVPSHDKYNTGESESFWISYPIDNIPSSGNGRYYHNSIKNCSSSNNRETHDSPPIRSSSGCGWSRLSTTKKVIVLATCMIILLVYLYVLFSYVIITGYTSRSMNRERFIKSHPE